MALIPLNPMWGVVLSESVGDKPNTTASGVYTGSEITNGYTCPYGVNMTGTDRATNGGVYTATYTPDSDHEWSDGSQDSVTVTLTISYVWTKWNSAYGYAQATAPVYTREYVWSGGGGYEYSYLHCGRGGFNFDSSNGRYSFYDYYTCYAYDNDVDIWRSEAPYISPPGYEYSSPSSYSEILEIGYSVNFNSWYNGAPIYYYVKNGGVSNSTKRYAAGYYYKGNTNYGNVSSINSASYPTNGRAGDGYWYVKTW